MTPDCTEAIESHLIGRLKMKKWISLLTLMQIISGCSVLERHPASGYREPAAFKSHTFSASDFSFDRIKSLEKAITDERERLQYYNALPWLKNEEERATLLSKPDYQSRQQWIRQNKIGSRPTEIDDDTADILEQKDIALDMPYDFVRKSWGKPDQVETAGNPIFKNERWIYKRYVSSSEGFKLQSRIVYFEGGKVAGWEQVDH